LLGVRNIMRRRRISDTIPKVEDDGVRSSRRLPVEADIEFLHPSHMTGVTIDASASGLRAIVDSRLEPGTRCVALVQLPSGEETHERVKVVWARRAAQGWLVGLEFVA